MGAIAYKLPPTLNPNRVFILQKSELEKRWDPNWYVYLTTIKNFKYKPIALKNFLLENPQYGANEIGIERTENDTPRYIRITDINEYGELENELGKTANTIEEKYFLKENDLLLARSGNTVGKSYLHKDVGYDCFFAGYMIRFKIDTSKINPEYIFVYTQTNFYKKWTKAIQRSTGQPNINAEEYRNLEIPIPALDIQNKIIKIYFDVLEHKRQNEAEASNLLASIDDYLLGELGIVLPKETYYLHEEDFTNIVSEPKAVYGNYRFVKDEFKLNEQSKLVQKKRIFITNFSEVTGGRFDSNYHQIKFKENLDAIKKGIYPVKTLKEIIKDILVKGILPKKNEKEGNNRVVQINSINNDGTISLDDLLTAKEIFSVNQKLIKGDVLIVITGATIGKVAFWSYEGDYFLGGDIVKFQTSEINDNSFVYNFLRSSIIQTELKRNITGATNGHLAPSDIETLPIPIPPLEKQQEIANHITNIRQQAQQLIDKTKEALAKANAEIEAILLG